VIEQRERRPSEILKRGYTDEEITHIYALGRFSLGNGQLRKAELLFQGITEIAPDFVPAWLGLAYAQIYNEDLKAAITSSQRALKMNPDSVEAMLFLVSSLLTTGDFNTAGTYLGEVGEKIAGNAIDNPNVIRFYKAQLARYQSR